HAGRQREEQEREELDRRQEADLTRGCLQDDRGDERDRDLADLCPEQRDRRGGPQLPIVRVAEQAAARSGRRGQAAPRGWARSPSGARTEGSRPRGRLVYDRTPFVNGRIRSRPSPSAPCAARRRPARERTMAR